MLLVTLPGVKRPLVRCRTCAGDEPPDDLPELLESGGLHPTTLTRAKREYAQAVKEWMPYRENREPGEEG